MIKAGIVIVNKFCSSGSRIFWGYINYMNRDEAVRAENTEKFNIYNDYMGNPEKSSGLFDKSGELLTKEQVLKEKELFIKAQDNGSLMWQTVISFDNRWLEEQGLYNSRTKVLNEDYLRQLAVTGIKKMLHNENLDHAEWTAAFHYNTDNIHIHVATVEVQPMREQKEYIQYAYKENDNNRLVKDGMIVDTKGNPVTRKEMKGKFSKKSFEICKQYIVNEIICDKDLNSQINTIIRDRIVRSIKEYDGKEPELKEMLESLYSRMPDCPRNMWNYGNNIMNPYKDEIDRISRYYIEQYCSEDYRNLMGLLKRQSDLYKKVYGENYEKRDFVRTKTEDLYKRMGNSILRTIRRMDSIESDQNYTGLENRNTTANIRQNDVAGHDGTGKIRIPYFMPASPKVRRNLEYQKAMTALKKSLQKDFLSWKNIMLQDRELEKNIGKNMDEEL